MWAIEMQTLSSRIALGIYCAAPGNWERCVWRWTVLVATVILNVQTFESQTESLLEEFKIQDYGIESICIAYL